ncbi:MAG: hypothetical protein E6G10_06965 [Actinobacteria bacterium]|nr:MAG: hypothetical protein E6G10_06965 [Actinomycetota bacterium]
MPIRLFLCPIALVSASLGVSALATAPAALAGPLVATATDCPSEVLTQPFLPWADPASYVLAPDGGFEAGASGWSLSDAAITADNESFYVHGSGDGAALELAPGGSATSAPMCVGIEHPTLRFFARHDGSAASTLRVDVLYEDAAGTTRSLTIGRVLGGDDWSPTLVMPVVANLLALVPGERTAVAFRFTAEGADAAWRIDDVYVDPYSKG